MTLDAARKFKFCKPLRLLHKLVGTSFSRVGIRRTQTFSKVIEMRFSVLRIKIPISDYALGTSTDFLMVFTFGIDADY
jgi:hypothetical protein